MIVDIGNEISINLHNVVSFQPSTVPAGGTFNGETLEVETHMLHFTTIGQTLTIRFQNREERDAKFEECRVIGAALRAGVLRSSGGIARPVLMPQKFQ